MKYRILIILLFPLLFATCKRNEFFCTHPTEIKGQDHLVDISPLKAEPAMLELLKKNPQLQVYRIIDDEYALIMHCNVFYKGFIVFTTNYTYTKGKKYGNGFMGTGDKVAMGIDIEPKPTITSDAAIKLARKTLNFGHGCVHFQQGFYDMGQFATPVVHDYRFVYYIEGDNGFPVVIVDANSSEILMKDDGIRF